MAQRRRTPFGTPVPQAIDPVSGFKVPLTNLVKQWDGEMVDRRFVDKRNPQDFVRGVPDKMKLPFCRPEPPEQFIARPLLTEDGIPIFTETGGVLLEEGVVPTL